jgi:hypothetical protein
VAKTILHQIVDGIGEVYSSLVLTQENWDSWFNGRTMIPGYETAEHAAEMLVKNNLTIFWGCPLCTFRAKDRKEAQEHIHIHANKFVTQFRIEVEE